MESWIRLDEQEEILTHASPVMNLVQSLLDQRVAQAPVPREMAYAAGMLMSASCGHLLH
ncbi:MAG: hypothetical protein ACLUTA_13375 [Blautia wexlerae]